MLTNRILMNKLQKKELHKKEQNKHSILFCTFFILNDILNR